MVYVWYSWNCRISGSEKTQILWHWWRLLRRHTWQHSKGKRVNGIPLRKHPSTLRWISLCTELNSGSNRMLTLLGSSSWLLHVCLLQKCISKWISPYLAPGHSHTSTQEAVWPASAVSNKDGRGENQDVLSLLSEKGMDVTSFSVFNYKEVNKTRRFLSLPWHLWRFHHGSLLDPQFLPLLIQCTHAPWQGVRMALPSWSMSLPSHYRSNIMYVWAAPVGWQTHFFHYHKTTKALITWLPPHQINSSLICSTVPYPSALRLIWPTWPGICTSVCRTGGRAVL